MSWASVDMWRWITAAHSEVDPTHYANKIQYTCVFVFEMPSLPTFTPWAFKTRTCNRKCTGLQVIADNTQTLSQAHVHSLSVDVCFLCVCVCAFQVEWTVSVLKVLSELSPVLLARGSDATGGDGQQDKKRMKMGQEGVQAEEMDDGGQVFSVIAGSLLPRSACVLLCFEEVKMN